jgi:chromatin remodeling complex protein RSC6
MAKGKKSDATTKATKVKAKAAEPVQETVAPPQEPVEAEPLASTMLQAEFAGYMTKLQEASSLISELKQGFRALEKRSLREMRAAEKASLRRKRKAGTRSPSGFVKPTLISNELAAFLGKNQGTEMARTEVTREINAYIRKQGLQDKANGRKINADKKLAGLLKLKAGEELTYFNLQKYMSPHFAKASKAADTQ